VWDSGAPEAAASAGQAWAWRRMGVCTALRSGPMPTPPSGRRVLERELAELPNQIAGYERELTETPDGPEHRPRRECLDWQIRNLGNTWQRWRPGWRPSGPRAASW
jgi:hypothetical protein